MCSYCYEWQKKWNAAQHARAKQRHANPENGMRLCMGCKHMRPVGDYEVGPHRKRQIELGQKSATCKTCRATRADNIQAKRKGLAPEAYAAYLAERRIYGRAFRTKLLKIYGEHCICCGETTPEFLELDHIDSGGGKHRKIIGSGPERLYRWAERNGFPRILQTLCANCHNAKSFYGGCPHQKLTLLSLVKAS